jgi:hypothetical protein
VGLGEGVAGGLRPVVLLPKFLFNREALASLAEDAVDLLLREDGITEALLPGVVDIFADLLSKVADTSQVWLPSGDSISSGWLPTEKEKISDNLLIANRLLAAVGGGTVLLLNVSGNVAARSLWT